jgi:hypothetical protein
MNLYNSKFKNGLLRVHIAGFDSWECLEEVAVFFVENLSAVITKKTDGVDARSWSLKIKEKSIILVYDDLLGTFFYSENPNDEPLLNELSEALKNSKKF